MTPADWYDIKLGIVAFTGLGMDALHVHVGVLLQLAAALLLRRSLASAWPWLVVLAAAAANEWSDLRFDVWPSRGDQYAESFHDVWNTLLLPTVLLLVARYVPGLITRPAGLDGAE